MSETEKKDGEGNWGMFSFLQNMAAPSPAEEPAAQPADAGAAAVDVSDDSPEAHLLKVKAEDIAEFAPAEVVKTLNAAVQTKPELNSAIVESCCKRLRVLCREPANCLVCDEAGTAPAVVNAMGALQTVPTVQLQALAALVNLCSGEENVHRANAVEANALKAVVAAMNALPDNAEVQEMACIALQNCCYGEDEHAITRRKVAGSEGALKAVLAAMKKHTAVPAIPEDGEAPASSAGPILEVGVSTLRLIVHKVDALRAEAKELGASPEWIKPIAQQQSGNGLLSFRRLGFGTNRRKAK